MGQNVFSKYKKTIESFLVQFTRLLYKHNLLALMLVSVFIGCLVSQIPKIVVDTSAEAMLHENDPGRLTYNTFRDQFGESSIIVIAITPPDVFSTDFLRKLKSFHNALENNVPFVQRVTSLINMRNTQGKGDELLVDDLLSGWPEKPVDLSELKKTVLGTPAYVNNIISEDGNITAVIIELEATISEESDEDDALLSFNEIADEDQKGTAKQHYFSEKENREVVTAVERIVARYQGKDFPVALTGGPVVIETYNRLTRSDFGFLFGLAISLVLVFLFSLFRRISGVVFPIIIVQTALFSAVGLMAIFKLPITLFSVVLPSFLIAVGIADAVHILTIFYRRLDQGYGKEDAILYAVGHSGLAVLMTSLTTAAGLLSFSQSELSALGQLGVIACAGVILTLFYTLIMLPALIALFPIKTKQHKDKKHLPLMTDRILLFFADFSISHPWKILAISAILFIVSLLGLMQLKFSHNMLKYIPDNLAVKKDVQFIDSKLKGAIVLEAMVDTGRENGIHDPALLGLVEKVSKELEKIHTPEIFVGKVFSIVDILKETNQALNENNSDYYRIPQSRNAVAQELLLFENSGSDDLERVTDSMFSKMRISIKLPWADIVVIDRFVGKVRGMFRDIFEDKADITITGMTALMGRTISAAIHSMTKSYLISFVIITMMMVLLVGDLKYGLVSMIPNLLPIFMVMGLMGMIDVPLDMTALMIGCIAIGLVVDDTMHFLHNFLRFTDMTGDPEKAIRETLLGTGRAMLITSLVLSANFFSLMTATLKNTVTFGFFTGLVILVALLADFILAPALVILLSRKQRTVLAVHIEQRPESKSYETF